MKNKQKKAWLRIVEAFLAILIVLSVVLIILSRQTPESNISDNVYEKQSQILDLISNDNNLRSEIITGENKMVNETIIKLIPSSWNFSTRVCNVNDICNNPYGVYEKDVYVSEILISSNLTHYNPKKLRFFVWGK